MARFRDHAFQEPSPGSAGSLVRSREQAGGHPGRASFSPSEGRWLPGWGWGPSMLGYSPWLASLTNFLGALVRNEGPRRCSRTPELEESTRPLAVRVWAVTQPRGHLLGAG